MRLDTITVLLVVIMNTAVVMKLSSERGPDADYCYHRLQWLNHSAIAIVSQLQQLSVLQYDLLSWTDWSSGWLSNFQ